MPGEGSRSLQCCQTGTKAPKEPIVHLALPGVLQRACVWAPSHTPQMCGCLQSPCGRCSRTVRSPGSACRADRCELVRRHMTVRNRAPLVLRSRHSACLSSRSECDPAQRPLDVMPSAVCSHQSRSCGVWNERASVWRSRRIARRSSTPSCGSAGCAIPTTGRTSPSSARWWQRWAGPLLVWCWSRSALTPDFLCRLNRRK